MPSLRRNYEFFFPVEQRRRKDTESVQNSLLHLRVFCWRLTWTSLLWWALYAIPWYLIYDKHAAMRGYRLFAATHVMCSSYGFAFALVLLLILNTDVNKKVIVGTLSLVYALYYGCTLIIVWYNYKLTGQKGTEAELHWGNRVICNNIRPLKCGVYLLHLSLEYAVYPFALLCLSSLLIWAYEWYSPKSENSLMNLYDNTVRRGTYKPSEAPPTPLWTHGMTKSVGDGGGGDARVSDISVLPAVAHMASIGDMPALAIGDARASIPDANCESAQTATKITLFSVMDAAPTSASLSEAITETTNTAQASHSSGVAAVIVDPMAAASMDPVAAASVDPMADLSTAVVQAHDSGGQKAGERRNSEEAVEVDDLIATVSIEVPMPAIKPPENLFLIFRVTLVAYWLLFAFAMWIWVQFGMLSLTFVNDNYAEVMLKFYLVCFVFKRPLGYLSSHVDLYRKQMPRADATENDLSLEILNEWMCSIVYFVFVRVKALQKGSRHSDIGPFALGLGVHIAIEAFASGFQPMKQYFEGVKKFRAAMSHIWDGTFPSFRQVSFWNFWHFFVRVALGWYMNNFNKEAAYEQWRDRCFIDSNIRLVALVLSSVMSTVQAIAVYATNYKFGAHKATYRKDELFRSLEYLAIQILVDLMLFSTIWYMFQKYEESHFRPYNSFIALAKDSKNPRYLLVIFVSFCCYAQTSLFM